METLGQKQQTDAKRRVSNIWVQIQLDARMVPRLELLLVLNEPSNTASCALEVLNHCPAADGLESSASHAEGDTLTTRRLWRDEPRRTLLEWSVSWRVGGWLGAGEM